MKGEKKLKRIEIKVNILTSKSDQEEHKKKEEMILYKNTVSI